MHRRPLNFTPIRARSGFAMASSLPPTAIRKAHEFVTRADIRLEACMASSLPPTASRKPDEPPTCGWRLHFVP